MGASSTSILLVTSLFVGFIAVSPVSATFGSFTPTANPNAAASWYTGSSIATSGTVIAAGAPGADTSETAVPTGSGTGYVALYNCPGGVATACAYTGQIAGPSSGSLFGATVVLLNSGGFLAVGAPGYSSKAGYVAMYSLVGGALSTTINSFAPGYGSSELGFSLAGTMSGTTLWVFAGAPGYETVGGGAGSCTSGIIGESCGTITVYICSVSGTTYSCPSQTTYLFSESYDNDGYAVAAAVVSSGVVGVVTADSGNNEMYVWGCSTTACGGSSSGESISSGNILYRF